jgi:GR25 family glycosyltransferase involved in LPS biosynthesis
MFDKIFIINLERDYERKKNIEIQFQKENITSYEFIHAVDGQNEDLQKYNFQVIPDWIEPYSSKIMTKGEIGCSLSHYLLWERIVKEGWKQVMILEDDVVLSPHFSQILEEKKEEINQLPYDLLYIGRRPLNEASEQKISDSFILPKRSYGTHAYILSLSGAQKLINSNYLQHLLPVDEFLPILYDPDYPHKQYIHYFNQSPRLHTYSLHPLITDILGGKDYKSTTYSSDPYVTNKMTYPLRVLIVITDQNEHSDAFHRCIQSCEMYGHSYKIIRDIPENKFGRTVLKHELLSWTDADLENTLLVINDCENIILNSNPQEILEKYKTKKIMFPGKKNPWPIQKSNSLTEYKYLNSGVFIGNGKHILTILLTHESQKIDLEYYTDLYANDEIILDVKCEILQTITHKSLEEDIDILLNKSRIKNKNTNTTPCILHGYSELKLFTNIQMNLINNYLGGGWNNSYKYCINNYVPREQLPKVYINYHSHLPIQTVLDYPEDKYKLHNLPLEDMVQDFLKTDAEYLFLVEKDYLIHNKQLLIDLIQSKKKIIAPMFKKKDNEYWSNFWGDLNESYYYKRSMDYFDIVQYKRKSLWNVPYITGIYLIHRDVLEQHPLVYIENDTMDMDMRFCYNIRQANLFMYVSNLDVYGIIVENSTHQNSIYDMDSMDWKSKYIHPNYTTDISDYQEPCADVFVFPLFTPVFCKELIDICDKANLWSDGKKGKIDKRIGNYENVPTQDIHLKQIEFEKQWEKIVFDYISPVVYKLYNRYTTKKINISFVVKYSMEGQKELVPHHDSSTYTVNICLNDEFEGGGCNFIRQNYKLMNKQIGYASVHPGKLTHYHSGLPITSGKRYILVSFIL